MVMGREKILQIAIPEKKFPASSKSPLMLVSLRMVQQPTSFGIVKMEGKLVLSLPKPELHSSAKPLFHA
jgi:dTDP-glucose pyrophosphorylase